jgi:phage-related protein
MKTLRFVGSSLEDLRDFVLHSFQKKTRKTRQSDIDLARQRYRQIGGEP